MMIHQRTRVVDAARHDLVCAVIDLEQKHGLTCAELISLLADRIHDVAKHAIRAERHPGAPNKKGDEA